MTPLEDVPDIYPFKGIGEEAAIECALTLRAERDALRIENDRLRADIASLFGTNEPAPDERYRHAEGMSPLLAAMSDNDCDCMGDTDCPRHAMDVPAAMGAVSTGWRWWRRLWG